MDLNDIDWNAMWKEETTTSPWSNQSRKALWEKQADSFNKRIVRVTSGQADTDKDDYISKMLQRVDIKPEFSVLDIGCGPGTLTIPLAKKAKYVTALDISEQMLKHLKSNAKNEGVDNIRYINAAWEDAFDANQVGKHDVVVASRCIAPLDIKETFLKLVSVARDSIYITVPIVHLPFDWEIYQVIGRGHVKHPSYIFILNSLYQMGIQANIEILYSRIRVYFPTVEEAIADLQWRTTTFTEMEIMKLTKYLDKKFAEQNDALIHEGKSKWALIWWNIKDNELFKRM